MNRAKKKDSHFQIQIFHKTFGVTGSMSEGKGTKGAAAHIH
jgi:hypothetical protein